MKAYLLDNFGSELATKDVTNPTPLADEVLIAVKAVSINPVDLAMQQGYVFADELTFPAILGCDVAGMVEAVGEDVTSLQIGDRVSGLINFPDHDGSHAGRAFAEYTTAPAKQLAVIPERIPFAEAAAAPAVALTAKQALVDNAQLKTGQRVLIHGAAGGVGHMAVQIAKNIGAHVIATASGDNANLVRSLGADEVINYKQTRFEDLAHDIDVVLNITMDDTALRSIGVMKPGGVMVTLLPVNDGVIQAAHAKKIRIIFMSVQPNSADVAQVLADMSTQKLRVVLDTTYPFSQLSEAMARLQGGGIAGKIVVTF